LVERKDFRMAERKDSQTAARWVERRDFQRAESLVERRVGCWGSNWVLKRAARSVVS
jgi:hypothetical protein